MKFKVDKEKCIGCGACSCICDDVFEIEDDGLACAKNEDVKDEDVMNAAIEALEGCPTSAITKED